MTKNKPPIDLDYDIFMANVEKIGYDATNRPDKDDFPMIEHNYSLFKSKHVKSFYEDNCFVFNRKEGDLLSVNFYSPKYTKLVNKIKSKDYILLKDVAVDKKNAIVDGPFGTQLHTDEYTDE